MCIRIFQQREQQVPIFHLITVKTNEVWAKAPATKELKQRQNFYPVQVWALKLSGPTS